MEFSKEIISILDYLCAKFGIAIDWTSENVMPYLESLCEKYIEYEIYTSIAWIVLMFTITIIVSIPLSVAHKRAESVEWDWYKYDDRCGIAMSLWIAFAIMLLASILVTCSQVFDIVECCTFPEKTIFEYLKSLMNATSN